jgi:threonine dehydratase
MAAFGVPDLADVLAARQRIAPYLQPTALYRYPALDAVTGTRTWVKHENHQPVGAFKVRGGVNLIGQLTADERRRGVIAASTGNHGQSVAYAADLFGVRAVICMPERANRAADQEQNNRRDGPGRQDER